MNSLTIDSNDNGVKKATNNDSQLFECSEGSRPTFTQINTDTKFVDNEDVAGVHLVNDFDLVREMQLRLGKFAKGPTDMFPVMWPVALSMKNVHLLVSKPYVVATKPSGPRFLLYIDSSGDIFLENMTQHIFRVDEDHAIDIQMFDGQPITDTVLDGIITREKCNANDSSCNGKEATRKLTFVILDAIRCNGNDLTDFNILQRIAFVRLSNINLFVTQSSSRRFPADYTF